jgi:hypothetical protein
MAEEGNPQKVLETGSYVAAWLTVFVGVMSIWDQLLQLELNFGCHPIFSSACNPSFRMVFPVNPILLFEQWAPVMTGLIIVSFHTPEIRVDYVVPDTNTKLGIVHLVSALWVNFGYAGTFGVLVGFFNVAVACCGVYLGRPGRLTVDWMREARARLINRGDAPAPAPQPAAEESRPSFAPSTVRAESA